MKEFARLIATLLSFYSLLIVVRIVITWMRPPQKGQYTTSFSEILSKIVDPYLNLFRGLTSLRRGVLDFTPLVALMIVNIAQRIFYSISLSQTITIGFIMATILQTLWGSIGSLLLWVFAIFIGIRLYFNYRKSPHAIQYISMLDSFLKRPMDGIYSLFFKGREVSDRTLLWTSLAITIALYVVCNLIVNLLVTLLIKLPI